MKNDSIIVKPHMEAPSCDDNEMIHTDIAQIGLYNATLSIVNSERNAVWQRYSAMLIANSIVFGFIAKQNADQAAFTIPGTIFGIILCYFWWLLTEDGWKYFNIYSKIAMRFTWPDIGENLNSNEVMIKEFKRVKSEGRFKFINKFNEGDRIKTLAFAVIVLFVCFYIYFLFLALFDYG